MSPSEPTVSVVLPTYNESQSLPVIVPRIVEVLRDNGIAGEVIIVDDDSPDGTADVARGLAETLPVRVIHRTEERGLATAVLAGFAHSEAPVCVVMDADGSHPVEALPTMVEMITADKADAVVGSRHVPGGGSKDWPIFSQLKSKFAASLTFGITSMTDPTTGFMAVRRELLGNLELDPVGWKIVLEIVVKAAPLRVAEVPIIFMDRELGESKQSVGVFFEYLVHLQKLYAHRYPSLVEFIKFCIVGFLGVAVDLGTVVLLKEYFAWDTRLCAVGGFTTAVTTNYLLNRAWTFRRARELPWITSYLTFVGASLLGLSIRILTIHALIEMASMDKGYGYLLSNGIGIGLATLFNFVGAKFFAFDPERLAFSSEDVQAPAATIPPQAREPRRAGLVVLAAAAIFSLWTGVATPVLTTADEGVNVTMARNMGESSSFLVRPSVYPGGAQDWLRDDLPELGNLPFYPLLLSLADSALGLRGMALLSFLAWLATLGFTYRLVALTDRQAAILTVVLMGASPALLGAFRLMEFEPLLTALGAAGLYYLVRGVTDDRPLASLVGGALLGLGFLTKMWLIVPYVMATAGFLTVYATALRSTPRGSWTLRRNLAALGLGFLATSGAHLAFVAVSSPQDLPLWIERVYLGVFSGTGVAGEKLSGLARYADAPRPVWYYPARLYHDHCVLLPLVLFGMPALARASRLRVLGALAMVTGALLGVVILSIPAVKEPLYVLPVTPLLYVLAGISLSALLRDADTLRGSNTAWIRAVNVMCMFALAAAVLGFVLGGTEANVSPGFLLGHTGAMLAAVTIGVIWSRRGNASRSLVALSAAAILTFGAYDRAFSTSPPHAAIAEALRPLLQEASPATPSFVARDHKLLRGYLGRTGVVLSRDSLPGQSPDLRAWVLSPGELADPDLQGPLRALGEGTRPLPSEAATGAGYRLLQRP